MVGTAFVSNSYINSSSIDAGVNMNYTGVCKYIGRTGPIDDLSLLTATDTADASVHSVH